MQIINSYFGATLLASIEHELAKNRGDRFDVCVGYAKNLTGATFERFGTALESWLAGDANRKLRLFIGDHRHPGDNDKQKAEKFDACTLVAAKLINFDRTFEEQMEILFLERLHAKFYSMWSHEGSGVRLEWAIIGSSNLTDAALEEKNIELDIYFESGDAELKIIQNSLNNVIEEAYSDGESFGSLHDTIADLTVKTRWHNGKLRVVEESKAEIEAEWEKEERRDLELRLQREADESLRD